MAMGKEFMPEKQRNEEMEQKTSRPNSLELNEQFMAQHGYAGQQYTGQFQGHPGAPPPGPPGQHPHAQQQGQYAYSNGPVSRASMAQYAGQQGQGYPNQQQQQQHMQYNHQGDYQGHYPPTGDLQNNMAAADSPQQSPSKQRGGMPRSGSGNVNSPMRPSQPPPAPPPGAMMNNNKDSPMGSRSGSASRDSLPPPPPPPPSEQGGQIALGRATPPYTGAGMANAMQGQRAVNHMQRDSPVRGVATNFAGT